MTGWIDRPVGTIVDALTAVPLGERDRLRDGPADHATFQRAFDGMPALRQIEIGGTAPSRRSATGSLKIAAWNVQRLRNIDAISDTLADLGPDVALLTEIDKGMARSGNGHRIAELAARLDAAYAYGVEFIELDKGDPEERAAHAGESNLLGFHGNSVVTDLALHRPFMIRLEAEGKWFGWGRGEPRVGSRMAIGGQIMLDDQKVTLVAVHLESHSDPAHRAGQVTHLLDVLDRYDPVAPVLVGGDFNTSTWTRSDDGGVTEDIAAALGADPMRRIRVERYEPLFAAMAARDFDWVHCNAADQPTERPDGPIDGKVLGKIDWFFSRGLAASAPTIIPAVMPDGTPSSDHECLLVTIKLAKA